MGFRGSVHDPGSGRQLAMAWPPVSYPHPAQTPSCSVDSLTVRLSPSLFVSVRPAQHLAHRARWLGGGEVAEGGKATCGGTSRPVMGAWTLFIWWPQASGIGSDREVTGSAGPVRAS